MAEGRYDKGSLLQRISALEADNDNLRARLAEVEAERDHWHKMRDAYFESSRQEQARAETAESRLARVVALCTGVPWDHVLDIDEVLAVARGDDDRG